MSVAVNLILDYLALLKTRVLIKLLAKTRPSIALGIGFVIFDFIVRFVLFQSFYLVLYIVSLEVIFGGSSKRFFLPAADPYGFYMAVEMLIALNFLLSPSYPKGMFFHFLAHYHAPQMMLIVTLVPLTTTSVFFYASLMPSIWLWLFLLAAVISRALIPIYPWAIRALDFEQNSIRTLGYLMATFLSFIWIGGIVVTRLYFFLLSFLITT